MGETSSRIEEHIAEERDKLDRNLQQLEEKARAKTASLRNNTAVLVGLAVAAGILLSLIVSRWTRG